MSFSDEKNENGEKSAYREEYIRVNGIREYLLHYPAAPDDPVILHIHGGPGAPASVFAYRVEPPRRNFGIVYYDQRGAGKTLLKNPFAKVSMADLKQDLLETVLYLKRVYRKEKIGILGHSWGSVLGSAFALEHPEHVSGYIGSGQMYCFTENEREAYRFLRAAVTRSGDKKAGRALKRIGAYPAERGSWKAMLDVSRVRSLQERFGLALKIDAGAKRILRESPVAGRSGLLVFALGGIRSAGVMKEFWNYDLRRLGCAYRVPVYYVMGDRDRTTPHEIARAYFDRIESPCKKWYCVPDAGHFAMLDNTPAWRDIVREIADELP